MKRHRLVHTKEERESKQCPHKDCSYSTNIELYMKRHIKAQHTGPQTKSWACPHCDHACKFRGNLKKHLLNKHKFSDEEATKIMKGVSKSKI